MKLEPINLKKDPAHSEKWVQQQIAADPSLLQLGDLVLRDAERRQEGAGRLDLLLQDPETLKRYEVELQLGAVDEGHIIRTIEYWDIERKRYPQYEHVAVIIAEDITSRFLNVLHLFNGSIPLIALKMTAYKIGDKVALTFVKVLDEVKRGFVDEDELIAEPADRQFWEKKGSKKSLEIVDGLIELVREVEPEAHLKYNRHYVGLSVNGAPMNFVSFHPRKQVVVMNFKLNRSNDVEPLLEEAGLELMSFVEQWRHYRVRIDGKLSSEQHSVVLNLVRRCFAEYTG